MNDTSNRILDVPPWKANRATRRACAKRGHLWKHFGDGATRCAECGEDR